MANEPRQERDPAKKSPLSRRELLTMSVGAAGLVAGSVVGFASKAESQPPPVQDVWLGSGGWVRFSVQGSEFLRPPAANL